jgi:hypothetical protein
MSLRTGRELLKTWDIERVVAEIHDKALNRRVQTRPALCSALVARDLAVVDARRATASTWSAVAPNGFGQTSEADAPMLHVF